MTIGEHDVIRQNGVLQQSSGRIVQISDGHKLHIYVLGSGEALHEINVEGCVCLQQPVGSVRVGRNFP